jgi:hypothetical protein
VIEGLLIEAEGLEIAITEVLIGWLERCRWSATRRDAAFHDPTTFDSAVPLAANVNSRGA